MSTDAQDRLATTKITPLKNGPLKVEGACDLPVAPPPGPEGAPIFLCRCGASKNKPFCDGSHKAAGFVAD
jgi:CDGSH-type Zn-finger protein